MVKTYDVSRTVELLNLMATNAENVEYKIYTHSGCCHKDDVSACAVASLLVGNPQMVKFSRIDDNYIPFIKINDSNSLILDVGKGRFDHHFDSKSESNLIRYYPSKDEEEPIQMSAIGRLWEYVGTNIVHETVLKLFQEDPNDSWCHEVANKLKEIWVKPISDTDTRGQVARPNFMSANVSRRCAVAMATSGDIDGLFNRLVDETREELVAYIFTEYKALKDAADIESLAWSASDKGHPTWVNLADENHDHIAANQFKGTVVRFIVEQSNRTIGEWNLNAVDSVNCPILDLVKQIDGFKFLHDKRFVASFTSKEAAEKAASVCSANLDIW